MDTTTSRTARITGSLQIPIGSPIPQEFPVPTGPVGPNVLAFEQDVEPADDVAIDVVDFSGLHTLPEPPATEPPADTLKDEVKPTFVPVAPLIAPEPTVDLRTRPMKDAYKVFGIALGILGALVLVFAVALRMAQPSVSAPVAKHAATVAAPAPVKEVAKPAPAPVAPAPKAVVDHSALVVELKAAKAELKSANDYLSRGVIRAENDEAPNNEAFVKSAQTALNVVMSTDITVDGKFGPATAELNGRFQMLVGGLPARESRNIIGQATLRALIEALADTSPQGIEALKLRQAELEESYDSEGTGVQSASSGSTAGNNGLVVEDKPTARPTLTDKDLDAMSQITPAPPAPAHKPTKAERASAGYDAVVNNAANTPSSPSYDRHNPDAARENEHPPGFGKK